MASATNFIFTYQIRPVTIVPNAGMMEVHKSFLEFSVEISCGGKTGEVTSISDDPSVPVFVFLWLKPFPPKNLKMFASQQKARSRRAHRRRDLSIAPRYFSGLMIAHAFGSKVRYLFSTYTVYISKYPILLDMDM